MNTYVGGGTSVGAASAMVTVPCRPLGVVRLVVSGSVGVANALIVDESMSDELAYELTKVLFDRQPDLAAIHPEAKKLKVETAVEGSPAPFHPGAIRYYRERGAWTQ